MVNIFNRQESAEVNTEVTCENIMCGFWQSHRFICKLRAESPCFVYLSGEQLKIKLR